MEMAEIPNADEIMSAAEVAAYRSRPSYGGTAGALRRARLRMAETGQWNAAQHMGRRWPVGCVALEVTQRCNLDCTLCYLSESSEAVKDLPLEEVFRRIEMIRTGYGPCTDVQITGGEPTLRPRDELVAIVRRAHAAGLRPALFTNGIRATRDLLRELCAAGLGEVAFHVDTTQQRPGYATEVELNAVRERYIERARGLPLAVYFNTTVHDGNFRELPALAKFFVDHSGAVGLASFQLQADTGRGVLRARGPAIDLDSVAERIREGAGAPLDFGAMQLGHARCNRFAMALVAGGRAYDVFDDRGVVQWFVEQTAHLQFDRIVRSKTARTLVAWAMRDPRRLAKCAHWLARKGWQMKRSLLRSPGRVTKISFFIHNFMDACRLERERIDACIFPVASGDGPVSMCLHNARRDQHLLKQVPLARGRRIGFWNPLTGEIGDDPAANLSVSHSRKTARGRMKVALDQAGIPRPADP
jgi:tetraether lipid synthase